MRNSVCVISLCVLITISLLSGCRGAGIPSSDSLTLNQLDLCLADGVGTLEGNIIVQVRDAAGNTPAISETTFAASDLQSNPDNWQAVAFSGCTLTRATKYRIYVQRSTASPTVEINWSGSGAAGNDLYPDGQSDWVYTGAGRENCDYAFRTYDDGTLDQSMETSNYGFMPLASDAWKWQEFVAGAD